MRICNEASVEDLKAYKRKFNHLLQPVKVMLAHRRKDMPHKKWLTLLNKTKSGILLHPVEYLGQDLPQQEKIELLIENIFTDFLKDLSKRS